jgi:hypothetical protein
MKKKKKMTAKIANFAGAVSSLPAVHALPQHPRMPPWAEEILPAWLSHLKKKQQKTPFFEPSLKELHSHSSFWIPILQYEDE